MSMGNETFVVVVLAALNLGAGNSVVAELSGSVRLSLHATRPRTTNAARSFFMRTS
jgi:hypothetical protein